MESKKIEELLESVFTCREQGSRDIASILNAVWDGHAPAKSGDDFAELESLGLVRREGGDVALTPEGETRAGLVVRRHRLAERLFHDLLDLSNDLTESQACEFEHVLSAEATESVCTLLGHPPTCPHGKPIPPGECCGSARRTVRPLVTGLPHLETGARARIVFIAPRFHDRMDRLASLGVVPGAEIRLQQRAPAFVLEVGETTLALDAEIAGEVYVKRLEG